MSRPSASDAKNWGEGQYGTGKRFHMILFVQVLYPINNLRNLALDNAGTSHVFLNDIDFIPDLYSIALRNLKSLQQKQVIMIMDSNVNCCQPYFLQALIVPAFEIPSRNEEYDWEDGKPPQDKNELLKKWQEGNIMPFQ